MCVIEVEKGAKQSRSEKKARKLFSKLGLKPVHGFFFIVRVNSSSRDGAILLIDYFLVKKSHLN